MHSDSEDDRSSEAQAYGWAARIISISLEMALPIAACYWLDQRLGTGIVLTVIGAVAGPSFAIWHLLRMTAADERRSSSEDRQGKKRP